MASAMGRKRPGLAFGTDISWQQGLQYKMRWLPGSQDETVYSIICHQTAEQGHQTSIEQWDGCKQDWNRANRQKHFHFSGTDDAHIQEEKWPENL